MTTHFRLFQSRLYPQTNVAQLEPSIATDVMMFYGALVNWVQVQDEVIAANPDLGEVLKDSYATLQENFGNQWLSVPAFVFCTNIPFNVLMNLLEYTESKNRTSEEKQMFILNSCRNCNFPVTLIDAQLLVEFSNLLDRDIGDMPLTLIHSTFNQSTMPIVGCRKLSQEASSSLFSNLFTF